jgi:membrane associated rhomboid family serine protease
MEQTCYRHPDRETGVSCSSCARPICTDCMTPTPVGMRCPECAKQKTKIKTAATIYHAVPRVTYAIIALNALAFVAQMATGAGSPGGNLYRSGDAYVQGVLFGPLVDAGEWWRLLTAGFLHDGPLHILLNMVGVYFLGQLLEPSLGPVRFAALYLASVLAGSFGALLLQPEAATIGASGGVFGLLGAAFVIMRSRGIDPMQSGIGPILILNLVITFAYPGISIGGHLGGLAGGVLGAFAILAAEKRRSTPLAVGACAAIGAVAVAGAIAAAGTPSLY